MKGPLVKTFSALLLAILVLGLIPVTAYAASPSDIVIGNNYTLDGGNSLNDDLVIIGGNVNLMEGSIVNGNVFLLGGSLTAAGTVNGDITVLGGAVKLAGTLVLNGNLSTAGASVDRDPAAQIRGQIFNEKNAPQIFTLPGGVQLTNLDTTQHPLLKIGGFFLRLFLWTLVAMVIAMFIPSHLERTAQTVLSDPLLSGGMGLLTIFIAPIVIILLAITICLIPVAILGAFLLAIAWAFGLISLGYEVGKRLKGMFTGEVHPAITTGLGTLALMIVLSGLELLIPCVGWIPKALVGLFGLGAVLLTQFGMKAYSSRSNLPTVNSGDV